MKMRSARLCALVLLAITAAPGLVQAATSPPMSRNLYAVNEGSSDRGSISVYDIDAVNALVTQMQSP